jgi:hypothetical protein
MAKRLNRTPAPAATSNEAHPSYPLAKMPRLNDVEGGSPSTPAEKPEGDQSYDLEGGRPGPSAPRAGKRFRDRL